MTIQYQIKPLNPNAHLFEVSLKFNNPKKSSVIFSLPNWIPGSYMIRDFSRNIIQLHAFCDGKELPIEKLNKSRWQLTAVSGQIELRYEIYAWDLSVRAAHLDNSHGFFNGTSVFLTVEGYEQEDVLLDILAPEGSDYTAWELASSLEAVETDNAGFGRYKASDYDELIDHPVEMGTFTRVTFDACDIPHEVVLTGRFDADLDRVCRDLKTICEYHINFFGKPAPMSKYVFLVMVVGNGYGGLEHRASTSLLISRKHLPTKGAGEITDNYLEFLGLCSHEYFHTWNVKRIKPAAFVPYQLQQESHTRLLWAFEGITSYYDDLSLIRCGLIDAERYLTLLSKMITRVYRGSGRLKQSVGDSSFDAWNKFYKQDENAPNAIVSYYAKGAVIAVALDCIMRQRSNGSVCLDDLMLKLWQNWLDSGAGVEEQEIEKIAEELTGKSLNDFFEKAIRGTEDLALDELLPVLGLQVGWRQAVSGTDAGGKAKSSECLPLYSGMRYKDHPKGFSITHVMDEGPAVRAGLSAGDEVVAIDSYDTDPSIMDEILKSKQPGDSVSVHFFRQGELRNATMTLIEAPLDTCYLDIPEETKAVAEAWLAPTNRTN